MQVERLLVGLGVELDPAGVALRHRVAVVVPDVDRRADGAVRQRHHDRQPEPGRVVERLAHVEQALAGGGRVGARAGGRGPDRHRHRRELGLDADVLARRELAGAHLVGERLDDVGLGRDRVGADHLGPAQRDRVGDRVRALLLLKHGSAPSSAARRARTRPSRRPRCRRRACPGTSLGSPPPRTSSEIKPAERGEPAHEHGVGDRPPEVLARELGGGHRQQALATESLGEARRARARRSCAPS